jgi:hypothetical protein
MRLRNKLFILFLALCLGTSSFARDTHRSLSPEEPRIKDFKNNLTEENPNFPEEMHLVFQELAGDFAIFYDLDGKTAQFRYRRNKWDREAMESVHNLLSGRTYRLKGKFLGILYYPSNMENRRLATSVFFPDGENLTIVEKKDPQSIPVYQLVSYDESYSDSIIFQSPTE